MRPSAPATTHAASNASDVIELPPRGGGGGSTAGFDRILAQLVSTDDASTASVPASEPGDTDAAAPQLDTAGAGESTPVSQATAHPAPRSGSGMVAAMALFRTADAEAEGTAELPDETTFAPQVATTFDPKANVTPAPPAQIAVDPEVEAAVGPRVETAIDPEAETAVDPGVEAAVDPRVETARTPQTDTTAYVHVDRAEAPDVEPIAEPGPLQVPAPSSQHAAALADGRPADGPATPSRANHRPAPSEAPLARAERSERGASPRPGSPEIPSARVPMPPDAPPKTPAPSPFMRSEGESTAFAPRDGDLIPSPKPTPSPPTLGAPIEDGKPEVPAGAAVDTPIADANAHSAPSPQSEPATPMVELTSIRAVTASIAAYRRWHEPGPFATPKSAARSPVHVGTPDLGPRGAGQPVNSRPEAPRPSTADAAEKMRSVRPHRRDSEINDVPGNTREKKTAHLAPVREFDPDTRSDGPPAAALNPSDLAAGPLAAGTSERPSDASGTRSETPAMTTGARPERETARPLSTRPREASTDAPPRLINPESPGGPVTTPEPIAPETPGAIVAPHEPTVARPVAAAVPAEAATPTTHARIARIEDLADAIDRLRPIPRGGAAIEVETPGLGVVRLRVEVDEGTLRLRIHTDDAAAASWVARERDAITAVARAATQNGSLQLELELGGDRGAPSQGGTGSPGDRDPSPPPRHHSPPERTATAPPHPATRTTDRRGLVDELA